MKNKLFAVLLLAAVFGACASPSYLPNVRTIDVNPYGSYIKVSYSINEFKKGKTVRTPDNKADGELIAVVNDTLLIRKNVGFAHIPLKDVDEFKLRYAKPKVYGWSIPLYTLFTFSHGLALVFTAPVNLLTTISVTSSGANDFQYNEEALKKNELYMFARFPQGLPPNVKLNELTGGKAVRPQSDKSDLF